MQKNKQKGKKRLDKVQKRTILIVRIKKEADMYVFTEEGFWVQKEWISEIKWNKNENKWKFYTKQESDEIIYASRKFKNEEEGIKWLKEEFKILGGGK